MNLKAFLNLKALKYALIGAGLGFVAAVAFVILGFGCDFIACTCSILTCDFDDSATCFTLATENFGAISTFCMIAGAIVGYFYGWIKAKDDDNALTAKLRAEKETEEKKLRIKLANELKQTALKVTGDCRTIEKENNSLLPDPNYQADTLISQISLEFANIAELEGEIDAMVLDASKEGV